MPHWDTPVRHYRAKPSPPSPHARRRRRIATASTPRRQHRNEATTGLLRGYYESYYEATTRLLRGYYAATTRLLLGHYLPGHYQATTPPLPGYYEASGYHETTTRSRPRATRPAAQQRQHRSPAGAAHASNLEPRRRRDPHTNGKTSRGGRSPHAEQAGQLIFILSYPSTDLIRSDKISYLLLISAGASTPEISSGRSSFGHARRNKNARGCTGAGGCFASATTPHSTTVAAAA
jgi:hypothetical protein